MRVGLLDAPGMDYQIIVIGEMHHDTIAQMRRRGVAFNVDAFDVTQEIYCWGRRNF